MTLDANTALCTMAQFCAWIGVGVPAPGSPDEMRYEMIISSASSQIESYIGRPLGYVSGYIQYIPGFGWSKLLLRLTPISNVEYIKHCDQLVDISKAIIEDEGRTGIVDIGCCKRPWTTCATGFFSGQPKADHERNTIEVKYSGGWILPGQTPVPGVPLLPPVITQAAILLGEDTLGQMGTGRSLQVASERLLTHEIAFDDASGGAAFLAGNGGIPASIVGMLRRYKGLPQW